MTAQTDLKVVVCKDASDAIRRGYIYREPIHKSISIQEVVVVQNGTLEGNPTVDFILVDEKGQKYAVMITGALLKAIPC